MGKYFDDFQVGEVYSPSARTVTEADVVAFAALSDDRNPVHTDAAFAARMPFGERIAHGLLGLAMSGGFLSRVGVIEGTALFLGLEWRFNAPIYFGDTIRAEITIGGTREASDRTRGVVDFDFVIVNQHGNVVQQGRHTFMVYRNSPAA